MGSTCRTSIGGGLEDPGYDTALRHLFCMTVDCSVVPFLASLLPDGEYHHRPVSRWWAYNYGVHVPRTRKGRSPCGCYNHNARTRLCDHFAPNSLDMWSSSEFCVTLNPKYFDVRVECFRSPSCHDRCGRIGLLGVSGQIGSVCTSRAHTWNYDDGPMPSSVCAGFMGFRHFVLCWFRRPIC